MLKKTIPLLALLFTFSIIFTSCNNAENDPECDICTASANWYKPGGDPICWPDKATCEAEEGGTCKQCN